MTGDELPRHVAIVMDGNGRWAEKRKRTRSLGHQAGLKALRRTCQHGAGIGIRSLTVFAFSSENWQRPRNEVSRLMDLFMSALAKEVKILDQQGVRIRFIGDLAQFSPELQERMQQARDKTRDNQQMNLNVAVNYGGRWDITQACRKLAQQAAGGEIDPADIDEDMVTAALSLAELPDPDLFIRTGGEMRISNFLLWQVAYTEFYFSPCLWPDFDEAELDRAVATYRTRERRFGKTGAQVKRRIHA
jgi:undecaprenyl diphosphate synthase